MNEKMISVENELKQKAFALQERVKEQTCLLSISKLTTSINTSLKYLFTQVVEAIVPAWQFPEKTFARILYKQIDIRSAGYTETEYKLKQRLIVRKKVVGFVEVGYYTFVPEPETSVFLMEEIKLLEAIGELVENMIEKRNHVMAIKKTSRKLKDQAQQLKNKNVALREIMNQIEMEKQEIKEQMSAAIKKLILPAIQHLKKDSLTPELREKYLSVIEKNLNNIRSIYIPEGRKANINFSPREIEIANMIKNGLPTKEIADILKLSILTVERHRFNIRKKLGINNNQVNLQTYLQEN